VYERGGGGDTADHPVGLSVLENDANVLFDQSKLLGLLPDLILVPAKEASDFRHRPVVGRALASRSEKFGSAAALARRSGEGTQAEDIGRRGSAGSA
jgi:hypothetical protein